MVGKKHHKFEAQTTAERDSWIVAIEKAIEESKAIKEEVTGRPSYKSTLEGYGKFYFWSMMMSCMIAS